MAAAAAARRRPDRRALALGLLLALAAGAVEAAPPVLQLPIDCQPGVDCFIQNHVDIDPGPDARDYTCGPLTYDGHRGTDIRLKDRSEMARGVAVLAPAAGTVAGVRDGEVELGRGFDPTNKGRECGNGVRIVHGDGWESQLCHMRKGSIRVREGERVEAGQQVGIVGLSGATDMPHVHLSIRHDGKVFDPFTGRTGAAMMACSATPDLSGTLWAPEAASQLAYLPSGLLGAGFADRAPSKEDLADGIFRDAAPGADAPALVFWGRMFGLRKDDVEAVRLVGPDGKILAETAAPAERDRAYAYRFAGKRRPDGGWPPGRYVGVYSVTRDGQPVIEVETSLVMP